MKKILAVIFAGAMLAGGKCGRGAQNPRDRKSKLSYNMSSFFSPAGKAALRGKRCGERRENPVTNGETYSIIKDMPAPRPPRRGETGKYDDTE